MMLLSQISIEQSERKAPFTTHYSPIHFYFTLTFGTTDIPGTML